MTQNNNILQELKELGSSLAGIAPQNGYAVPDGYFDGLVNQVLNRIKALEAENVQEELGYLSSTLNSISKQMPYSIPAGYFEGLENRLMEHVRESGDYQTAKEELETLSPMLSGLKKQMPYQVPQGYFENLNEDVNIRLNNKTETKIVSISSRRWFRYAVAAMIVGVIVLGGLLFWNQKPVDPDKNPDEWVAKNVKKVNAVQLDDFIKLADQESTAKSSFANTGEKPDEIKELMKDVPDNQIQELLNETAALDEPGDNTSLN
jgi:hypothetical protein